MNTQEGKNNPKSKKAVGVTAASLAAGLIGVAVIANSNFAGIEFNPDKYAKNSSKNDSDILFDGVAYSAETNTDNSDAYSDKKDEPDDSSNAEETNEMNAMDNLEAGNEIRVGAVSENGTNNNAVDAVYGTGTGNGGMPIIMNGGLPNQTGNTDIGNSGQSGNNPNDNPNNNPSSDNTGDSKKETPEPSRPSANGSKGDSVTENKNPSGSTVTPPPKKDDGGSQGDKEQGDDKQHSTNSGQPVGIKVAGSFMNLCQGQSTDSVFADVFGRSVYLEFENGDRMLLRDSDHTMAGFTLSGLSTANVTDSAVAKASYTYNSKTFTFDIPYSVSKWRLDLYRTENSLWRSLTPDKNLKIYLDQYYEVLKGKNPQFYGWSEEDSKTVFTDEYMMTSGKAALFPRISMQQPNQTDGSTVFKIPEGYTDIDVELFTNCSQYTEIEIPSSLQSINFDNIANVFPNLKSFKISSNEVYRSVDGVLYEGDKLVCVPPAKTSIHEFADGVKEIGKRAFENTQIKQIELPETVTVFDDEAFMNANIENLIITAEDYSLGERVFYSDNGSSVKNVTSNALYVASIKNNSLELGEGKTVIIIPDSMEDMIYQQYLLSWGMGEVSIITKTGAQNRNKLIGNAVYSFFNKKNEYTLAGVSDKASGEFKADPNTVGISERAFYGCSGITSISIGKNVRKIDDNAFYGANNLGMLIMEGAPPAISENTFASIQANGFKISVPYKYYEDYMSLWGSKIDGLFGEGVSKNIIEPEYSNVKNIDGALYTETDEGLVLIQVPRNISGEFTPAEGTYKIEKNAFVGDIDLLCVTIPESVTEISPYAVAENAKIGRVLVNSKATLSLDAFANSMVFVPRSMYEEYSVVYDNVRTLAEKYTADKSGIIYCGNILFYVPMEYSGTLKIPQGITEIYEGAMENCSKLTGVIFNGEVESIAEKAFYNCNKLKTVDFADSPIRNVDSRAFYGCVSLQSANLGDAVEEIGEEAFARCDSLNSINISTGIKSIGKRAFYECNSLNAINSEKAINLASLTDLQYMGEEAFAYCSLINSISFGSYAEIPDGCFSNCVNLKEINSFGGVKKIGENAFSNTGFVTVTIPDDTVSEICSGAFSGCSELRLIQAGEGLSAVAPDFADENANIILVLNGNSYIEGIAQAIERHSIYGKVFTSADNYELYCELLGKEHIEAASGQFRVIDGNLYEQDDDKNLRLLKVNVNANRFTMTSNGKITSISEGAFENCDKLEYIEINKSVEEIPEYAFKDCTAATTIELKAVPVSSMNIIIGNGAFSGCRSLAYMNIPNNVAKVGEKLFMDDVSLISVTWGAYDSIKADTFNNCTSLEAVTLTTASMSSITNIGDRAFYGCESIRTIMGLDGKTQISGLKEIGSSCFENCSSLDEMVISSGVEKIGDRAFANCNSLSMIKVESPNLLLGSYVFGDEIGTAFFGVSDVDTYVSMWGEQLDREYGSGASKQLIRDYNTVKQPRSIENTNEETDNSIEVQAAKESYEEQPAETEAAEENTSEIKENTEQNNTDENSISQDNEENAIQQTEG